MSLMFCQYHIAVGKCSRIFHDVGSRSVPKSAGIAECLFFLTYSHLSQPVELPQLKAAKLRGWGAMKVYAWCLNKEIIQKWSCFFSMAGLAIKKQLVFFRHQLAGFVRRSMRLWLKVSPKLEWLRMHTPLNGQIRWKNMVYWNPWNPWAIPKNSSGHHGHGIPQLKAPCRRPDAWWRSESP